MLNGFGKRLVWCLALLMMQSACLSIKAPERIDLGGGERRHNRVRDDDGRRDRHDHDHDDDDDDDDRYDDDD